LAGVPEGQRQFVEPLIPGIVNAIHYAFSIATGTTFVVGIVSAALAAVVVAVLLPAGKMGESAHQEQPEAPEQPVPSAG
jgi:hypothetical protein